MVCFMGWRKTYRIFILACILLFGNGVVIADDFGELKEKSLEELMEISVVTVSKHEQKVQDAPAIVTVYTADQIRSLGLSRLSEVMSFIPGFTVTDSYWKKSMITARGIKQTLYNDKILFLIDGVPANDAASMEHHLDLVPLTAVERIEVIRGPGSTLYGTNAFSGVINVITRKAPKDKVLNGYTKFGSFHSREIGYAYGEKFKQVGIYTAGQVTNDDGYDKSAVDESGITGTINYENDIEGYFGKICYRNLHLTGGYSFERWGKFGAIPRFAWGNMLNKEWGRARERMYYLNSTYDLTFSPRVTGKIIGRYDYFDSQTDIGETATSLGSVPGLDPDTIDAPVYARFKGQTVSAETQAHVVLADEVSLIAGAVGEVRIVEDIGGHYDDVDGHRIYSGSVKNLPLAITDFAVYSQLDGNITPRIGFAAGIRYSYLDNTKSGYVTPRGGLIFRLISSGSVKLLYGEAFRSPSAQELYMNIPDIVVGNYALHKTLDPEKIKTIEFAIEQTIAKRHTGRINSYYTEISAIIGRRPTTPEEQAIINSSAFAYDNLGRQIIRGIEVELSGYPSKQVSYFINGTYKTGKDSSGNEINYISHYTASGGVSLNSASLKTSLTPSFYFVGSRKGRLQNETENKIKAYAIVNLFVNQRISGRFNGSITLKNLLDTEYVYPEQVRRNISSIPGGPSRGIYISFGYQ